MEKIIHKLINEFTEGVDTYTHNNSTWLIFTETKQWVIELTDNKTLWYNYNFFKSVFAYASLDCVQNQHLITKWVEDNVMNKVSNIRFRDARDNKHQFEDTLENGVKETRLEINITEGEVDDIIQDGVKETDYKSLLKRGSIEDTLENGVKETKQKKNALLILDTSGRELILESHLVVRDGVKETSHRQFLKTYDVKDTIQDGTEHDRWILDGCDDPIDEVLDNGVKITTPLQSREYTGDIDEVLGNGIKSSIPRQYVGENIIDKIIDKGVIETHREICEYKHTVEHIIQTGVKETIECDWNIPKYVINEVISEGVKKTMVGNYTDPSTSLLHIKWGAQIEDVIDNGNKVCGTYVGGHRQEEKTETVIEYGKQI